MRKREAQRHNFGARWDAIAKILRKSVFKSKMMGAKSVGDCSECFSFVHSTNMCIEHKQNIRGCSGGGETAV